jgi:hypothetical protein
MANDKRRAHVQSPRLSPAEKSAIVAAVASGQPKTVIAKQFNVHRNTVTALCKSVRAVDNPANPLREDYRESLRTKAAVAVEAGLDCTKDEYKRAGIGVRVLEGIGEFGQRFQVEGAVAMTVTWGQVQEPNLNEAGADKPIDVESHLLGE